MLGTSPARDLKFLKLALKPVRLALATRQGLH